MTGFISQAANVLDRVVGVLIAIALLVFVWGLVMFIANSGHEDRLAEGRRRMMWGVAALFVIVSIWGLVALLQQITGISGANIIIPRT